MDEKRNYVKFFFLYTVALYPGVLKLILAIFDVPQTTDHRTKAFVLQGVLNC